MGIHDYSCFFCSIEGEQNLSTWPKFDPDDDLIDYPLENDDTEERGAGDNSCYIFYFPSDTEPLKQWQYPASYQKVGYSWDNWDFEPNLDYESVFLNDKDICSIWFCSSENKELSGRWLLNVCSHCFSYFIDDSEENPPPELLYRILLKFRLLPFKKFNIHNILSNFIKSEQYIREVEDGYEFPIMSHFFPLSYKKLYRYIKAFAYYLGLRKDEVNFRYKNYARNPAIVRLEKGGKLEDDDPNFPGRKLDRSICRPLDIALERKDIEQISECISNGAKISKRQLDIILRDDRYSGLISRLASFFDRKRLFYYYAADNRWLEADPSFFVFDDIENVLRRNYSFDKLRDDKFLLFLISLFPEEYKDCKYYGLVCDKKISEIKFLLDLGFSPQTHFAHAINMQWIEGVILFQNYGAKRTNEVNNFLKKDWMKKEIKQLFQN